MEPIPLPEETKDPDETFWQGVMLPAADVLWDNAEDDVYAELLTDKEKTQQCWKP